MGSLSGRGSLVAAASNARMMQSATRGADALRLHVAVQPSASADAFRLVDDRVGCIGRLAKRRALTLPIQGRHLGADALALRKVLGLQLLAALVTGRNAC